MGMEQVATQAHVNVGSHGFARPTQTNDHSNPQQGPDGLKPNEQIKQSTTENKSSNPTNSLNDVEDKPKLFVGGLPRTITEPEFRFFFSQFGELHESVVMFDRDTGRSRGFGFVTYVDPEISKSILQMGSDGDGIGRLAMRGKICEIKAALPKGEAPSRGLKANRGNRNGTSNQNQPKAYCMTPFVYNEQMAFAQAYSQGGYPVAPFVPGYAAAPMYHPAMHGQYLHQNQGAVLLSADHEFTGGGDVAGAPYFYTPPFANSQIDCFPTPDGFLPTQQNPYYYSQYGYSFIPLVPGPVLPVAQTPVEQGILMMEENNDSDGEAIEIKKE